MDFAFTQEEEAFLPHPSPLSLGEGEGRLKARVRESCLFGKPAQEPRGRNWSQQRAV